MILERLPANAGAALDVGCGDGDLVCELAPRVERAVGIDADAASIGRARQNCPEATFVHGDFLAEPFEPASFDLVTAVASLHHMDAPATLAKMARLVRPGGTLVVIGLARPRPIVDLPMHVAATVANVLSRIRRGYHDVIAPTCWPAPLTFRGYRELARNVLPGAVYRRHLYWRYSIVWTKH